jgi:hypothetical protein
MALYTKKEFSEICGIKSNRLAVHIKRHEVIMSKLPGYTDYVDGENALTRFFVTKRIMFKKGAKQKAERLIYKIASKYRMKISDMQIFAKELEDCINEAADDVLKHKEHLRVNYAYMG